MDSFVLHIPESIELTDEQLLALCEQNSHLCIETDAEQNLTIMSLASSKTGHLNAFITSMLFLWDRKKRLGKVFDSSAGFKLPDGSVKSPDTAFVEQSRWDALSEEEQAGFANICPDFVLELRSPTDSKAQLLVKMDNYMENGCSLAWLIDPLDQEVHIYRPDQEAETMEIATGMVLQGEGVLPDFTLNVDELFEE